MKELFKQWLAKLACMHTWRTHCRTKDVEYDGGIPRAITETLICEKCGKIKKITL